MSARQLAGRLRGERGQGLIELLAAMTILSIAIAGLLAAFSASIVSLDHSGHEGTALTLAERQMEAYRSLPFTCIPSSLPASPVSPCTWSGSFPDPYSGDVTVAAADSPDHQAYKITTTLSASGGTTSVTVSVRCLQSHQGCGGELARESSNFSANGTPS